MENKRCFLVGAGSFDGFLFLPEPGDLVIAADGGCSYLEEAGIRPDILVGDFDSIERIPEQLCVQRHSPEKDDTDMALAAACAAEKGCRTFFIYGGMGGRIDHTIANLQLLTGLSRRGLAPYLIGEGFILSAVTDGAVSFSEQAEGMISVFCAGETAEHVTEQGLKYGIKDGTLFCDRALGVSNEFIGEPSGIEVKKGTLLLCWEAGSGLPAARMTAAGFDAEAGASSFLSEQGRRSVREEHSR